MDACDDWTRRVVALSLGGAAVVIVDPFFHYHAPRKPFVYDFAISTEEYQNPGMVLHFDYDSILTGSSMVENFSPSWFQEDMGLNVLKVPYSGATAKNTEIIVRMALKEKKTLKRVFWGLDLFSLEQPTEMTRNPLPMYLYDDIVWSDTSYLLNKDVLLDKVGQTLDTVYTSLARS